MKNITEKLDELEKETALVLYTVNSIIGSPIEIKETFYKAIEKDEYGIPGYFITMKKQLVHIHSNRMNDLSGTGIYEGKLQGGMWALKDDISAKQSFVDSIKKSIDNYVTRLLISKNSI